MNAYIEKASFYLRSSAFICGYLSRVRSSAIAAARSGLSKMALATTNQSTPASLALRIVSGWMPPSIYSR